MKESACSETIEVDKCLFFMPPTLEKLKGHIALGLSMRPSISASVQNLVRYSFVISYMDSSLNNN